MTHLRLLRALRGARGLTATELARQLGVPVPSVRRLVGELRAYGMGLTQTQGFYRLQEGQ